MDKPWKVVFAFVAVFIAGAVFGGVFTMRGSGQRLVNRPLNRPPPVGQPGQAISVPMMRQMAEQLKLTEEQREKIRVVVARVGEDLQRLRRENFQATNRVLERMHADIAVWLTPEQRTELEAMRARMQQRLNSEKNRGGDPMREGAGRAGGPRNNPRNPEGPRQPPPKSDSLP